MNSQKIMFKENEVIKAIILTFESFEREQKVKPMLNTQCTD